MIPKVIFLFVHFLLAKEPCYFLCLEIRFVHFLLAKEPCYFLCLDAKKVTKERSRLQIILGLLFFSLPTQYNSSSFVLLKQYCLQQALAAIFKTVAFSQNSLRPFEIQPKKIMLLIILSYSAKANEQIKLDQGATPHWQYPQ